MLRRDVDLSSEVVHTLVVQINVSKVAECDVDVASSVHVRHDQIFEQLTRLHCNTNHGAGKGYFGS